MNKNAKKKKLHQRHSVFRQTKMNKKNEKKIQKKIGVRGGRGNFKVNSIKQTKKKDPHFSLNAKTCTRTAFITLNFIISTAKKKQKKKFDFSEIS